MKLFRLLMMILLSLTSSSSAVMYAKPGCKDMCGKVRIPYPFGIGTKCSINEWYNVDCNSSTSTPYLSKLNSLEVLEINLENRTVTVNVPMISDCRNPVQNNSQISNVDLDGSPFLFAKLHNKFVVEGCGNAFILDQGRVVTGCGATCGNDSVSETSKCLGISCCQTTIPYSMKSYSMNLTSLERQLVGGDGVCGSAFLMDENSHVRSLAAGNISYVPTSLLWTLTDHDSSLITCCRYSRSVRVEVDVGNGQSVTSYKCGINNDYDGNPYIRDGCEVRLVGFDSEDCQRCRSDGGYCDYDRDATYDEDGMIISKRNMTCDYFIYEHYEGKKSVGVILEVIEQAAVSSSGGVNNSEMKPELIWNRSELSVMLEHVQAHVAPTDVDPGATQNT